MSFYFTTSWDDGSVLDIKLVNLLDKYNIQGTFYIPKRFDGSIGKFSEYNRRLTEVEIKEISLKYEIGGHSISHNSLLEMPPEEAKREIFNSQVFIQDILGHKSKMFCFPKGHFNDEIVYFAKEAGFMGVRTTKKLSYKRPNQFIMDVTAICQPFPFRKIDSKHYYWRRLLDPLYIYKPFVFSLSWLFLAKKLFSDAYQNGDYFHLYGHSWEIEKYNMWGDLELFFKFVKSHKDIKYITNGELMDSI